jgi:multiple sugar transport system permease protein
VNGRLQNAAGYAWISPWIIGFVAFLLLPIGMSLYYGFTDYPLLEKPLWVGLDNFKAMLEDRDFLVGLKNTLIYVALLVPLSTVVSVIIAGLLTARGLKGVGWFQAAVFLPTLVPLVATSMVWMWLLNGKHGLINQVLAIVGVIGPNWLLDRNWAMAGLVLVGLWSMGQSVLLCYAALREVPVQLYEAAGIDGMGPVRRFRHVTVPMISPVILFNTITTTIGAFQVFVIPYVIFQKDKGGPGQSGYFYTMCLYDNAFVYQRMGYASAMAWVQLLIVLGLTGLMFLTSRRLVYYRTA